MENAPEGKIRKPDVSIAKNYLSENELNNLNRIVTAFLDFAELRAQNHWGRVPRIDQKI